MASLDKFIQLINRLREIILPLNALLFEAFLLALATIHMWKYLRRQLGAGKRNRGVAKARTGSSR